MSTKPLWIIQADAALRRAARRAYDTAVRTGTLLCVYRDGKVVRLMPAEKEAALREEPSEYGTKKP